MNAKIKSPKNIAEEQVALAADTPRSGGNTVRVRNLAERAVALQSQIAERARELEAIKDELKSRVSMGETIVGATRVLKSEIPEVLVQSYVRKAYVQLKVSAI